MGRLRQQRQRQSRLAYVVVAVGVAYLCLVSTSLSSLLRLVFPSHDLLELNTQQKLLLWVVQHSRQDSSLPTTGSSAGKKPSTDQLKIRLAEHFVVLNRCIAILKRTHRLNIDVRQSGSNAALQRNSTLSQEMWAEIGQTEDQRYHELKHRLKMHVKDTQEVAKTIGLALDADLLNYYEANISLLFTEAPDPLLRKAAVSTVAETTLVDSAQSLLTEMLFVWPLGQNDRHPAWHSFLGIFDNDEPFYEWEKRKGDAASELAETATDGLSGCSRNGLLSTGPGGSVVCECTLLWRGNKCDQANLEAQTTMTIPVRAFTGDITLGQQGHQIDEQLSVLLPDKKGEDEDGVRLLGTLTQEVLALLPPEQVFNDSYRTCAIVGSSGILLHHEHGEDIDSHDMVMRFNSAKTLGFEKYVGSKTTHRITNTQNFNFRESDSEQILVHMRAKGSFDSLVKTLTEDPTAKVAGFDPSFDLLVTSGMYGIVLALHKCARLDAYGFQVSVQHGTLYHYYGPCDQPANPTRDGMEYEIFKDFVQHGFVNLKDDCVLECHEGVSVCEACKEKIGFTPILVDRDRDCVPCEGGLIVNGKCRMSPAQRLEAQAKRAQAREEAKAEREARIQARKEREERRRAREGGQVLENDPSRQSTGSKSDRSSGSRPSMREGAANVGSRKGTSATS